MHGISVKSTTSWTYYLLIPHPWRAAMSLGEAAYIDSPPKTKIFAGHFLHGFANQA